MSEKSEEEVTAEGATLRVKAAQSSEFGEEKL